MSEQIPGTYPVKRPSVKPQNGITTSDISPRLRGPELGTLGSVTRSSNEFMLGHQSRRGPWRIRFFTREESRARCGVQENEIRSRRFFVCPGHVSTFLGPLCFGACYFAVFNEGKGAGGDSWCWGKVQLSSPKPHARQSERLAQTIRKMPRGVCLSCPSNVHRIGWRGNLSGEKLLVGCCSLLSRTEASSPIPPTDELRASYQTSCIAPIDGKRCLPTRLGILMALWACPLSHPVMIHPVELFRAAQMIFTGPPHAASSTQSTGLRRATACSPLHDLLARQRSQCPVWWDAELCPGCIQPANQPASGVQFLQ
ncbi:hypothetical protein B0T22DRAFT_309167 [Podospora appendiculata]|uniref:Uncharacterized protein n=1 Tax=Podospora appendiculata TaxID=314037 RepID=A0AAE0WYK0_9PEZI|nr:hypothetical protein B0T22DRAFT_309167 [Podospora appendiculata]